MARNNKSLGSSGTLIYGGQIDEDYAKDWRDLSTRIPLIQKMVDGVSSTTAALRAIKGPLLSAKYFIQENENISDDVFDFAKNQFFEYQSSGFKQLLTEIYTTIENGFSLFEKVPKIVDNKLYYDYQIRVQKSIESWEIAGKPWKNGHPAGVTQRLDSTDENPTGFYAKIPWEKITLFTVDRIGNNFEGKSVLRSANIHFQMLQMLYKISMMAEEKYGVGTPYAKTITGLTTKKNNELSEMLLNIRANEKGYALFDNAVEEFGIMTPDGKKSAIMELIEHHKKSIYDAVLAGFLNLGTGDGGSNALSKDQSSFFLVGITNINDMFIEILNRDLKELIIFNFGGQKIYPELAYSDVGKISLDEYTDAMATAKEKGLVDWTNEDQAKYREQAKLPKIDPEDMQKQREENLKNMPQPNKIPNEKVIDEKKEETMKKDKALAEKKNLFLGISPRERMFLRNIGDYENYLESEYTNVLKMFEDTEKRISNFLIAGYSKVDTERVDGIMVIDSTAKNRKIESDMIKFVKDETKKLEKKVVNSKFQERLFDNTKKMAVKGLFDNEKFFAETITVDEGQFKSFISGYVSNIEAVLFNDTRRTKESVVLNFGSQVSVDLAAKQAGKEVFNRNVLKLSTITHSRGAYNTIQYNENVKNGFTLFKVNVPKNKVKTLSPTGRTANWLWLILLAAEITRRANEETEGKNTDAITGMNLHHGAFVYYYPISAEQKKEEEEIAKEQRKELKQELQNQYK